jgi:hypothetical protein
MKSTKAALQRDSARHRSSAAVRFKAAVAVAQGRRHAADGVACQDAVARLAKGRYAAIALADGAGTARYAARGATLSAAVAARHLVRHLPKLLACTEERAKATLLTTVLQVLRRAARALSAPVEDFACTLLFAATDGRTLLLGQIGDGRVGVRDISSGLWRPVLTASKGEFINETTFVTSRSALARFQLARGDAASVSACVLMSDGAEDSLFHRATQTFAPAVESIAQWVALHPVRKTERALAQQLSTVLRTRTFDDVGLACMSRCSAHSATKTSP